MNLEKTVKNMKLRGFQVSCFPTAQEAVDYLGKQIQGTSVGIGGSKTVDQIGLYDRLCGREPRDFTRQTAIGALGYYVSDPSVANFQPMNINFSIISPLDHFVRGKKEKNLAIAQRALNQLARVLEAEQETGETAYENHH